LEVRSAAFRNRESALIIDGGRRYTSVPPATHGLRQQRILRRQVTKKVFPGKSAVVNAVAVRTDQAAESTLQPALRECVARAVRRYLQDRDSQTPDDLYALVLEEVEKPLLREVLAWAGGNQSRAATALGINRATLRKKLAQLRIG
jgi:Fis family transcriptional regulator